MTETFVRLDCPSCALAATVPAAALLVSLTVDGEVDARPDEAGLAAWTCLGCADLVSIPVGWPGLLTLVAGGADLLAEDADDGAPEPHPEDPAGGAPLTRDDLLALHELLADESWFEALAHTGCVNP